MTEEEWLAIERPGCRAMLSHAKKVGRRPPRATNRKFRLLAVALARCQNPNEELRRHCDLVERYVDGLASQAEFGAALQTRTRSSRYLGMSEEVRKLLWHDAFLSAIGFLGWNDAKTADLIREVFGNPFRSVAFAPEWRTGTAVALANQMYITRDFSAMPILADALQDAGCTQGEVLTHCQDVNQVHVRGCWVVDLVLGKS
ncbi:MAG TPA: hypothetical protein VGE74_32080 [Gemmata sp.]